MVDATVSVMLEQFLLTQEGDAPERPEVATFAVGGRKFQILEQTIRSRGQTLLHDLLNDPERKDKLAVILVEGDSDRFRFILDWYRFGSIHLPFTVSVMEMRRECAFFALPEDVVIVQDSIGQVIPSLQSSRKRAHEECIERSAILAAHVLFDMLFNDPSLVTSGRSTQGLLANTTTYPNDWNMQMIRSAVFPRGCINPPSSSTGIVIQEVAYDMFKSTLDTLAQRRGLSIMISVNGSNASFELKPIQTQAPEESNAESS